MAEVAKTRKRKNTEETPAKKIKVLESRLRVSEQRIFDDSVHIKKLEDDLKEAVEFGAEYFKLFLKSQEEIRRLREFGF